MPKYLLIYRTETVWPVSGTEIRTDTIFFDTMESAQSFADSFVNAWDDCTDIQIYEYTGIQYVLVERRHHT